MWVCCGIPLKRPEIFLEGQPFLTGEFGMDIIVSVLEGCPYIHQGWPLWRVPLYCFYDQWYLCKGWGHLHEGTLAYFLPVWSSQHAMISILAKSSAMDRRMHAFSLGAVQSCDSQVKLGGCGSTYVLLSRNKLLWCQVIYPVLPRTHRVCVCIVHSTCWSNSTPQQT